MRFIVPDLLAKNALDGLAKVFPERKDLCRYVEDCVSTFNTPQLMFAAEESFGHYSIEIPLLVCDSRVTEEINKRYKVPSSLSVNAAILPFMDTREPLVFMYDFGFGGVKDSIVQHELVHLDQIKRGTLVVERDGSQHWTVKGEEFSMTVERSLEKINEILTLPEYVRHNAHLAWELEKPWELEAYAKTMREVVKLSYPESFQKKLKDYLTRI